MEITELLGEGAFRVCYATNDPNLCLKKMKPIIRKSYFGIDINFNMKRYLRIKFGISDLNRMEFVQISKLPVKLKPFIPSIIELNGEGLLMERPKDYDGEYSKSIIEAGEVKNKFFWTCVNEICDVFDENQLWFNDVFYKGNNVMVKKLSKDKYVPIMIDLKEVGKNLSPIQFNLIFKSEQKKKFYRRFKRFENAFYRM